MMHSIFNPLYGNISLNTLCRCLTKNSTAVVHLEVSRPVCIELYQDCRDLGRFMLRSGGTTIAAGVVTKVSELCVFCDDL